MRTLIELIFGSKKNKGSNKSPSRGASRLADDNPATIEDDSENGMRRQLVHVLLRDALRRHGIPADWIDCRMLVVSSRSRGAGMYVRLIVRHWDERLMRYLFAFEKTLITDIERFEPRATTWLHGMSWQIEPVNECPYPALPEKSFWQAAGGGRASQFGDIASRPAPLESRSRPAPLESRSRPAPLESRSRPAPLDVWPGDARTNAARAAEMAAAVRQANAARRAQPAPASSGERLNLAASMPFRSSQFDAVPPPFSANVSYRAADFDPAASKTAAAQTDGAADDIEQLFAIRDRELGVHANGQHPGSYDKTEPSPLDVLRSRA